MNSKSLSIACCFGLLGSTAFALTESEAVFLALKSNPTIRIEKWEFEKDKLDLRSGTSISHPHLTIKAPVNWTRSSKTLGNPVLDGDATSLDAGAEIEASQALPGGGTAAGAASLTNRTFTETDSAVLSTATTLSLRQPLLKGFGKGDPVRYQIRLQRNNFDVSRVRLKEMLASVISKVRRQYWSWVATLVLAEIREEEKAYAQREIKYQRALFQEGMLSAIDTLGATVQWLKASGALTAARQAKKQARRDLAELLFVPIDSLGAPAKGTFPVAGIGDARTALEKARKHNPELQSLHYLQKNVEINTAYFANRVWPSLDIHASLTQEASTPEGQSTQTFSNTAIGLLLSYPVYPNRDRFEKSKTQRDRRILELRNEKTQLEIEHRISGFFDAWQSDSIRHAITLAQEQIARQRLQAMEEEEKQGSIDPLTRLQIRNDFLQARADRLQQAISLKALEIALDQTTLDVLDKFKVEIP